MGRDDSWLITDHADTLKTIDDLWPLIEAELDQAAKVAAQHVEWFRLDLEDYTRTSIIDGLRDKFSAGEKEHGRDWLNMSVDEFSREIRNEIRDLVIYMAMRRVRWRPTDTTGSYQTNQDPGDEAPDA